ncbi:MAG: diaminopimelate epimerase [Firmicutes bacterium]|nr:diaminopimelate epimerase [Bacillota bacterium]
MRFSKMHGLGNDFIMINGFKEQVPADLPSLAQRICHRHLGVGADGMIILSRPEQGADVKFRYYNDDGSPAEMCGNGARCAALFAKKEGIVKENSFAFETLGGIVKPMILDEEKGIVKVDMGEPVLTPEDIPARFSGGRVVSAPLLVYARMFYVTLVSMGNPHCVIFVEDLQDTPVEKIGPQIEHNDHFPAKINVEFVKLISDDKIAMRVWERGCGETLACGTGACAATVASVLNGYTKKQLEVELTHGSLMVDWAENNHVFLTGPAVLVAEGDFLL